MVPKINVYEAACVNLQSDKFFPYLSDGNGRFGVKDRACGMARDRSYGMDKTLCLWNGIKPYAGW